jgi:hypothetical protein
MECQPCILLREGAIFHLVRMGLEIRLQPLHCCGNITIRNIGLELSNISALLPEFRDR